MTHQRPVNTNGATKWSGETGTTGLGAGTIILTLDGALPVEHLAPGDRIITRDSGAQVLRGLDWIDVPAEQALVINPAALDRARPESRVVVAAEQPILLRDWLAKALYGVATAMTPARFLIDGKRIRPAGPGGTVRLYQLTFKAQHVIYAGGLELASAPVAALAEAA